MKLTPALILLLLLSVVDAPAQLSETATWTATIPSRYWVKSDITYAVANGYECKLDVFRPAKVTAPVPTVVFIHGGGWVQGTKEESVLQLLPYLEMGFAVVNVEYRLARVSLAPAAVEDCRRALRWVFVHAKEYQFDPARVVVTGTSAGGHLALMTGMLDASAGFDQLTEYDPKIVVPHVAAIINWYGVTDVADLLEGPNYQQYAAAWLGSLPNRKQLARTLSPLTYVRKTTPPILSIHGDHDQMVPYSQAVRLHEALNQAGVKNELITIPGGNHGGFSPEDLQKAQVRIRAFLKEAGVL